MGEDQFYYYRNLPHYQSADGTFFGTTRLFGSLPESIICQLRDEYLSIQNSLSRILDDRQRLIQLNNSRKRYFAKFDDALDKARDGPKWLRDERVAKIVADAIHAKDGIDYSLAAYTIMPNHFQLVVSLPGTVERTLVRAPAADRTGVRTTAAYENYPLTRIMRKLKGSTAREANKVLERNGAFWQHESYDHLVRDDRELTNITRYVLNNPVKAGLVQDWREWKWSYCEPNILRALLA